NAKRKLVFQSQIANRKSKILSLRRRDISHRAWAEAENPPVLAQRAPDEGAGAGDELAGVRPVGDEGGAGVTFLLGVLHDRQLRRGQRRAAGAGAADVHVFGEINRRQAQQVLIAVDADPAAADFQYDLRLLALLHQAHAADEKAVAQLGDQKKILRRRVGGADQVGGVDVRLAVAQRLGGELIDGLARRLGLEELFGGGARRIGDANGGAPAA